VVRDGQEDEVAVEEPLEIRVNGAAVAGDDAPPGHDEELTVSFLYRRAGSTGRARPARLLPPARRRPAEDPSHRGRGLAFALEVLRAQPVTAPLLCSSSFQGVVLRAPDAGRALARLVRDVGVRRK
jgi:hypothetical protein